MQLLELSDFLKLYKLSPADKLTIDEFIKKATVVVGKNTYPLADYMASKKIEKSKIELLLKHIQSRKEYLTRFYNMSLRLYDGNLHIHGNIAPMKNSHMDNNTGTIYKNLIRNIHYKDILQNTLSGMENTPTYMNVLNDLYKKLQIDYKILTPSAIHYMSNGRLGSVFSSYYFRASIMNPYLVYSLNKNLLRGTMIFTPTLGWSSYAFGFLECPEVKSYVGTDVIPNVCNQTKLLVDKYNAQTEIYCQPSEDLYQSPEFLNKYREHFDVVFFSPPYFKLELYKSKNQSTTRYKDYNEWLNKYWESTIKLAHHVLEKKGRLCYILSGYGSNNTKEQYDLLKDMNKIASKYFGKSQIQPMHNKNVHSTNHRETGEQIMLYVKK
uniref:DNA methylase N-4/N-6 domain-containing protein n=1 Tax=viral metagenome TaxID=1070528 RepID=A0A6C0IQ05_9ZZZZ